MSELEQSYRTLLQSDPGDPQCIAFADLLRESGRGAQAVEVLVKGLSKNPSLHRARLLLSKIYCEMDGLPFAVRELLELQKALPDNIAIKKLLERLSPSAAAEALKEGAAPTAPQESATLAEAEFDLSDLTKL